MLKIERNSGIPIYQQIYEQIKADILSGNLPEGFRMTSTRMLADELRVGRNSVESAYDQLVLEGYMSAVPGSGYTVNRMEFDLYQEPPQAERRMIAPVKDTCGHSTIRYSFQYGELGSESFPSKLWRTYVADMLDEPQAQFVHGYCDVRGDEQLRQEIRRYLYRSRGVRCETEQVILCSGTQSALEIIIRLFPDVHSVAMEEPGYNGSRAVFQSHDFQILPVPVGEKGIDLHKLSDTSAPMVYVAPSHQFPTGAIMPIQSRMELLNLANERDMMILEDDYDSEFRYKGQPIPSLQSIDKSERVIYIGTFSKVLSAGLRMAYLVLPKHFLPAYQEKFQGYACTVPLLEQKVLARFMEEGQWEKQLRRICLAHKKKHDILVSAITQEMGDRVRLYGRNAGLHLLLEFTGGQNERALLEQALSCGVQVCPASPFWSNKDAYSGNALVLGYGKIKAEDILPAVKRLRQAWFG